MALILLIRYTVFFFFSLSFMAYGAAQAEEGRWTVGLTGGLYQPSLKTLNRVLETPQIAILQDPNFQLQPNTLFRVEVRNIKIPEFKSDAVFGVEAQRILNDRHSFLVTVNTWDSTREASDVAPQITGANVSDFNDVPRTTRYNLSIVQLWLGWRYAFFTPTPKNRFFIDIGLIGGAFGQMTVDTLLKVPELADDGFPIVSSLEASGWGVTTRWGLGADYAFNKWLRFSMRAAYIFGEVPQLTVDRFFPSGFSTPPVEQSDTDLEPRPEIGEVVTIADVESVDPKTETRFNSRPLPLELTGFEFLVGIEVSF